MAVYVDDMRARFRGMLMCHMIADTDPELHAMADRIGVQRRWWQSPERTSGSHYDIALSKRALAVRAGAIEITQRQAAMMNAMRRATGVLGTPDQAHAWYEQNLIRRKAPPTVPAACLSEPPTASSLNAKECPR